MIRSNTYCLLYCINILHCPATLATHVQKSLQTSNSIKRALVQNFLLIPSCPVNIQNICWDGREKIVLKPPTLISCDVFALCTWIHNTNETYFFSWFHWTIKNKCDKCTFYHQVMFYVGPNFLNNLFPELNICFEFVFETSYSSIVELKHTIFLLSLPSPFWLIPKCLLWCWFANSYCF